MAPDRRRAWPADLLAGLVVYALTSLPVAVGLAAATTPGVMHHAGPVPGVVGACLRWDGGWFLQIRTAGYDYHPGEPSAVAFFPGLPAAAGLVERVTGCGPGVALVATANAAFAAALVLLSAYLRARFPDWPPQARWAVLTAAGLWPAGVVFRMAYSEGPLLACVALLLLGLARRWPAGVLAVVAGVATGVRAAGVACPLAVMAYVLLDRGRGRLARRAATAAVLAPVACWGLLGYMAYQADRFGDPLAFARTQTHWRAFHPTDPGLLPKLGRLAVGEPVWDALVPGSPRYWAMFDPFRNVLLGTGFWNPVLFAGAAGAVVVARRRGWLTGPELALAAGLWLVPYLTRADELSMLSHARFTVVVVPVYVAVGRAAVARPAVGWAAFAVMAVGLAGWTALFAAGHGIF